jgi:hypothetical protein
MTQHDYSVSNQTFTATRSDINNAFAAILSQNSGTSAPVTTVAGMLWYDTTNGVIKQRNAADSGWNSLFSVGDAGFVTQSGSAIYAADTGSATAYAIAVFPIPLAYVEGMTFRFKPTHSNTGAATLNVNSLGAVPIRKQGSAVLVANDLIAGQAVEVIYDGTNFQVLSAGLVEQVAPVFNQAFESSLIAISVGTSTTPIAHGLGAQPTSVETFLKCATAEFGYLAGQEVPVSDGYKFYTIVSGGTSRPIQLAHTVSTDSTHIIVTFAANTSWSPAGYIVADRTVPNVGNAAVITNSRWNLIVRVRL